MPIYLVKYRPLVSTREGALASLRFHIPPYVDGSCRREPDFECKYPSISALCRRKIFVPRLQKGDEVIYITTKGFYGEAFEHWRIVARLKIINKYDSHQHAATWYRTKIGKLPNNCMVPGNPPMPLSHTSRGAVKCAPGCGSMAVTLKQWNGHYQKRADAIPDFFACRTIWNELASPAILTEQAFQKIAGSRKRVVSRSPVPISEKQLNAFTRMANRSA